MQTVLERREEDDGESTEKAEALPANAKTVAISFNARTMLEFTVQCL